MKPDQIEKLREELRSLPDGPWAPREYEGVAMFLSEPRATLYEPGLAVEFLCEARNAMEQLLDERDALLDALRDAATKLGDAHSTLSHCWASETPPSKQDVADADAAEDAARAALAKAES